MVRPGSAEASYVAMVEENEIRVNLSHYERARIAVRFVREGVFSRRKDALQTLFGNATRAKRSKIGSFVTLVEALDAVLFHPTAISEKLGLALARAIEADAGFAARAKQALQAGDRSAAESELAILTGLLTAETENPPVSESASPPPPAPAAPAAPQPAEPLVSRPRVRGAHDWDAAETGERIALPAPEGVRLGFIPSEQKIEISGPGVSAALAEALQAWLKKL